MKKLASWLPGFSIGIVVTFITSFVQADRIRLNGVMVNFGLVLATATLLVVQRWTMSYFQNRVSGIAFALAWLFVTIRLAIPNSDGDLALGAAWYSVAYLGISAMLLSTSAMISPRQKIRAVE